MSVVLFIILNYGNISCFLQHGRSWSFGLRSEKSWPVQERFCLCSYLQSHQLPVGCQSFHWLFGRSEQGELEGVGRLLFGGHLQRTAANHFR